jgi:hypothetical protein
MHRTGTSRLSPDQKIGIVAILAALLVGAVTLFLTVPELRKMIGLKTDSPISTVSTSSHEQATTNGPNSPAIAGGTNTFNYGNPGAPAKASPQPKESAETKVTGKLVPPQKGKEVKILVDDEKSEAVPDEFGRFQITVHKRSTERARVSVWINGEQVYDDYQPLSGPVTLSLN